MNELQRAQWVCVSQGRPRNFATALPPEILADVAALCDEKGVLVEGVGTRFQELMYAYADARKAVYAPADNGDTEAE